MRAGGRRRQLAARVSQAVSEKEYATGYALATPRSSFAATEERMLENQIRRLIHFTLDFTENSNSESKKNGERRYRRLHACLTVDRSGGKKFRLEFALKVLAFPMAFPHTNVWGMYCGN